VVGVIEVLEGVFLRRDAANVYVLRDGSSVVLVDAGDGSVAAMLEGVRVSDVLLTHHHRDSAGGAVRLAQHGARVWVPEFERHLLEGTDAFWARFQPWCNYSSREDRYSPLEDVRVGGVLREHEVMQLGTLEVTVLPTPGHTSGGVSLLGHVAGKRVVFTGDLIFAPGKVWSLAATQWSYNGLEGVASTVLSLLMLRDLEPDVLLPAHGEPMWDARTAIDATVEKLLELLHLHGHNPRLLELRDHPFEVVTPHLLRNRTSFSYNYVLRSRSGTALVFDWGFDFVTGHVVDTLARRPSVYNLETLKRQHGISGIDAVIPTHYHDDHVAGLNHLRRVAGAQVWAADVVADVLEKPARFNLPCLWAEPTPVDRRLPLETPIPWEEYTLTVHALPGHTRHAVAISFNADGERVLVAGDQYSGSDGLGLNYVYGNGFEVSDYVRSAELYARLEPTLILTGHWEPQRVQPGYFAAILERGRKLERLHRELLPERAVKLGSSGFVARLEPYQLFVAPLQPFTLEVVVGNPFERAVNARLELIAFGEFTLEEPVQTVRLEALGEARLEFTVCATAQAVSRARFTVDVTLDDERFAQVGEALVSVVEDTNA
jgi:glyoxylase-like metal-dependent hydrolase (beta-lactamase superfamily II)